MNEENATSPGNEQRGSGIHGGNMAERVMMVIDEVIQKVRQIIDHFEGLIHEFMDIFYLLSDFWREIKGVFNPPPRMRPHHAE